MASAWNPCVLGKRLFKKHGIVPSVYGNGGNIRGLADMASIILRSVNNHPQPEVKPFLKWVGGKRQSLPHLMNIISHIDSFGRYYEPFVGGGALYYELWKGDFLASGATLTDINEKLIECYIQIRDNVENVISQLLKHANNHNNTYYYSVRCKIPRSPEARAARLIYLNKTCYNGLFRENSRGEFNVPLGRYTNPCICDITTLRACSLALSSAHISAKSFEYVVEMAQPGDLVYFDPPYQPTSRTASFTSYSKGGFNENCQRKLAEVFSTLALRGVYVLLSNSDTPLVNNIYQSFRISRTLARRNINSRCDLRGNTSEVAISNF